MFYRQNTYILGMKSGDVNGDGIADLVYLTGRKTGQSDIYYDNIAIIIKDGRTNVISRIQPANAAGYNAQLFLGSFTDEKKADILVSIDTGGSGGYILAYLYSMINGYPAMLFDNDSFEQSSVYNAQFRNDFKVEVSGNNYRFVIDVSNNRRMYIDAGIYNTAGRLLKPTEGGVLALRALYPLASNYSGLLHLLAYQRIIGIYNADNLGAIQTYLKWDGRKFISERVEASIMPV